MTTSAAENTAGRDKEKVEKRRALGRGLESLLPGPRVVPGAPAQSSGAAGKQQVPHFVRDDKASSETRVGEAFAGTIQAVVDDAAATAATAATAVPTYSDPTASDETITLHAQAESRMPGNLVVNLAIADIDKNPFQTRYV